MGPKDPVEGLAGRAVWGHQLTQEGTMTHDDYEPSFPMTSADRARFWAGLNRLLELESDSQDHA